MSSSMVNFIASDRQRECEPEEAGQEHDCRARQLVQAIVDGVPRISAQLAVDRDVVSVSQ